MSRMTVRLVVRVMGVSSAEQWDGCAGVVLGECRSCAGVALFREDGEWPNRRPKCHITNLNLLCWE